MPGSIFVIALGPGLGMASKVALAVVMVSFVVFGNALGIGGALAQRFVTRVANAAASASARRASGRKGW